MAVLPPDNAPKGRRPSLRGVMMQDIVRGSERLRIWPKARGRGRSEITKEQNDTFRQAMWACKYWPADIQHQITEAVKGSPLLPRDLMVMIMYGRFCAIQLESGKKLFPMQTRRDVSDSLDALSQVPGSMIWRGQEFWEALLLGDPMQIMQVAANGLDVQWADAPTSNAYYAAGSFHWDGANIVISKSFNVASITRSSQGLYEIVMANPASDAQYMVFGGGRWPVAGNTIGITVNLYREVVPTIDTFYLQTFYNNAAFFDPDQVFFQVIDIP